MDLSRLRRELRIVGYDSYTEALALLDALDIVHEDAEQYESRMRDSDGIQEEHMIDFLRNGLETLVRELVRIESIGVDGVLSALTSQVGQRRVSEALENWKEQHDEEAASYDDDTPGDLDTHLF